MKLFSYIARLLPVFAPIMIGCVSCSDDDGVVQPEIVDEETDNLKPVEDVIIYQVNPKLFENGKSFAQIDARLPEIKKLGTNVLYLMPLYPEGFTKAVGSPYCITDYKAVNPAYGSLDELKQLVNDAHSSNMRVMFDWVANHTSWDCGWLSEHKDWYTQDGGGNVISPAGTGWNDVADLNFDNKDMRTAMKDAMLYWVREIGIDGYRCDYADGVPADFWQEAITALKAVRGDKLLMLAESSDKAFYQCGFDMVYGWTSTAKLQELYAGKITLDSFYAASDAELAEGAHARFITNHDQASEKCPLNHFNGKAGALSAFVLNTMLGGYPFIYSSQEVGYDKNLSFFNQWLFDWNSDAEYTMAYQQFMTAYVSTADLRAGKLKTYSTGNVASFFYEADSSHGLLVFVNPTGKEVQIKTPMEQAGSQFTDVLTGSAYSLSSALTLGAYQYLILRR